MFVFKFNMAQTISSDRFYSEYHGHRPDDLKIVQTVLRANTRNCIYLAGDSSLDNKFWFGGTAPAVNGYEDILSPPYSKQDIAYWLNFELEKRGLGNNFFALNCAVEESSVGSRSCMRLLEQDRIINDSVTSDDIVVVSVGGNDIVLKPNPCTILSTLSLICCTTTDCLRNCTSGCSLPCDDCCCGCGTGS